MKQDTITIRGYTKEWNSAVTYAARILLLKRDFEDTFAMSMKLEKNFSELSNLKKA